MPGSVYADNPNQKLNQDEIKRMIRPDGLLQCPDCSTELLQGPCGGWSINMKCPLCDVVFNWMCGAWCDVVEGQRRDYAWRQSQSLD